MTDESKCPECNGFRGLPRMLHDTDIPRECSNAFHRETPVAVAEESAPTPAVETAPIPQVSPPSNTRDPVCPYCGADPGNIMGRQTTMGPYVLMVIRCANQECRKTLAVFPIGQMDPTQMPQGMPPGLRN